MDSTLEGRRALVTGAASGIGLAVARRLQAAGVEVIASDRPGTAVPVDVAGQTVAADLSDRSDVTRLAEAAGVVDILVNNAGVQYVHEITEYPDEHWDRVTAVMLTAPFLLTRALLPGMYAGEWGRIVNVASVHGLIASPYKAAYVAAKHGLVGLTKVVALEAGGHPGEVSAHAICPSYVRTPMVEAQVAERARLAGVDEERALEDVILAPNAVKRLIEPDEVAEAVLFCCGPLGWTMSGSPLTLDAGWLAH